jgi:hypothetical protein
MSSTTHDGLAAAPTGPELGMRLALIDPRAATDEQLFDLLHAETRQLAYQQARTWAVLAEIATRDPMPNLPPGTSWTPEQIFESAVDEVRAELRLTRRSARRELDHADAIASAPRVMQALTSGAIDRTRAIILANGCFDLADEQHDALLDAVLPDAAGVTATRLAEKVQRAAIALDPAWAERRYKQAVRDRKVIGYLNSDGSATVSGQYLPAEQASAACARVDALADAAKRAGAHATIDHVRAEVFLGLLDGRFHGMTQPAIVAELLTCFPKPAQPSRGGEVEPYTEPVGRTDRTDNAGSGGTSRGVHVRVGLGTLLGVDDQPGEIAGWGPVIASVARSVAARQARSEWRFAIVDEDGNLLFDGITRRRPRIREFSAQRVPDGIVEVHVPAHLLDDPTLRRTYPEWAGVLADLRRQYVRQQPIEQDPAARFPGRPLRRRTQTAFQRCIFPGCRRPASDCDVDHRQEHGRGGRTDSANLGPGCRHDHLLKTNRGWRLVRRDERTFVWISPLGRRHVVTIDPIAPPLPEPIPRTLPAEHALPSDGDAAAESTFHSLTRRGRTLGTVRVPATATVGGNDPPPF